MAKSIDSILKSSSNPALGDGITTTSSFLSRPLQFLPEKDKNEEWYARNIDWLEFYGYTQLFGRSRRLLKNYKLVAGVIDKEDYVVSEDNEASSFVEYLTEDNDANVTELKFYPIVPRVINTLVTEFNKRKTEILYRAVDPYSINEIVELKKQKLQEIVYAEVSKNLLLEMTRLGLIDKNNMTPEQQQQLEQMMSQDNLNKLPQIQEFFDKTYALEVEDVMAKIHEIDVNRFRLDELESYAFVDLLTTSSEFWHFKMMENDYSVELWNPLFVFYRKNPNSPYISEGDFVGKVELMTVQEVIDKYGKYLDPEQIQRFEHFYGLATARQAGASYQNDGAYWVSQPGFDNSIRSGSLDYRRTLYWFDNLSGYEDIINKLYDFSEDFRDNSRIGYLRVTTAYWKTQRKVGLLTKIDDGGRRIETIVTEDYKVTTKPVYNNSLVGEKSAKTLVYGEHIDWIWINEVVGGIKIGPNVISYFNSPTTTGNQFTPIYLGIGTKKPGRLKFQFKNGYNDVFGCRLPVEGLVYTERNVRVSSLVDLMKPFQIAYNLVNNQIMDILLDELGSVVLLDQNVLPKHSLGEDWGTDPYMKAYIAMKTAKILPVDTSIANTENPINFNHFQLLNLEQSGRLQTRIQLAEYFKRQCLETIGFTMERLMGASGQYQSAKSAEISIVQSYNVTEKWFTLHCDNLMPRVHEMRTNLAQYYLSFSENVPTHLINVLNTGERQIFKLNPDELALRDLGIYVTNKINYRSIVDQIKQLVMSNNTLGMGISDIVDILGTQSYNKLQDSIKRIEERRMQQQQMEMEQKRKELMEINRLNMEEKRLKYEYDKAIEELKARYRLLETQLKSYGFSTNDINENKVPDVYDLQQMLKSTKEYKEELENTDKYFRETIERQQKVIDELKNKNNGNVVG